MYVTDWNGGLHVLEYEGQGRGCRVVVKFENLVPLKMSPVVRYSVYAQAPEQES